MHLVDDSSTILVAPRCTTQVIQAFNNIDAMRQQMKPSWRVHGIITEGGLKPNIIPDRCCAEWYIRALTVSDVAQLRARYGPNVSLLAVGGLLLNKNFFVPPIAVLRAVSKRPHCPLDANLR